MFPWGLLYLLSYMLLDVSFDAAVTMIPAHVLVKFQVDMW
jgi:hypothetical protein